MIRCFLKRQQSYANFTKIVRILMISYFRLLISGPRVWGKRPCPQNTPKIQKNEASVDHKYQIGWLLKSRRRKPRGCQEESFGCRSTQPAHKSTQYSQTAAEGRRYHARSTQPVHKNRPRTCGHLLSHRRVFGSRATG